jgi:4-hydroxy-3-methylbut-2-enyl diphosphate reductase
VAKVHLEVLAARRQGLEVIVIGHRNHPEVEGTMGQVDGGLYLVESVEDALSLTPKNPAGLTYVTQTTLSVDETRSIINALKSRFPHIQSPKKDDICYATQNRQDAVKVLAKNTDLVLVVGAPNSSNSRRLVEVAKQQGVAAYLIEGAMDIQESWLTTAENIGVTAGASAPEVLVQQVIEWLKNKGATQVEQLETTHEDLMFSLPPTLRTPASLLD